MLALRTVARMAEAYSRTTFDELSVGQPPARRAAVMMSDDWHWLNDDDRQTAPLTASTRRHRRGARPRRRDTATASTPETSSPGFVGLMQQLAVDGRELFELAERGDFDVVDSTATNDDRGRPVTFTSSESYLSLSSAATQASSFSIYFRVCTIKPKLYYADFATKSRTLLRTNHVADFVTDLLADVSRALSSRTTFHYSNTNVFVADLSLTLSQPCLDSLFPRLSPRRSNAIWAVLVSGFICLACT